MTAAAKRTFLCKACDSVKRAEDFYSSDHNRCKECVKARVRKNREMNADYYRAYDRKRYREQDKRKEAARKSANSPRGIELRKAHIAKTRAEQPEKYRARNAVSNALRDGKITKASECYFCGSGDKLQAHHHDYSHPLDVVWLCPSCHGKLHAVNGDFRRA